MGMDKNPLMRLEEFGQSVWLDYIRRDLITGGGLNRMIIEDGLKGMTSNPAIFEKAILESRDYDVDIKNLSLNGMSPKAVFEELSLHDVRLAADEFRPVYDRTLGKDGYVSLEVNPHLAHDTKNTVEEARRLWGALDRPNVFIKVPATDEGLPAIKQLTAEGINVNITLLFGLPRYRQIARAYIDGLEERLGKGLEIRNVASVASFFLSRIDTLVDPDLDKLIALGGSKGALARLVNGQVAIASAKTAYMIFREMFGSEQFIKLTAFGAPVQRVLWASTGTKNPLYSDVKYVEPLIGPDTVNTLPMETMQAYRDHGNPKPRLEQDTKQAQWVLEQLPELGINIDQVTKRLEVEGVEKFNKPYDKLMATITEMSRRA